MVRLSGDNTGLMRWLYEGEICCKYRWFRIIDESGEDYLYPPELFEVIGEYNIRASDDNQL